MMGKKLVSVGAGVETPEQVVSNRPKPMAAR
jgi:hypothetical protein